MSFDDQRLCRLCFATEDSNSDEVFCSIKKYLPFLGSLTGISHDESMPQKICPNCEYHIENTQLLRKRIQLTEILLKKYNGRSSDGVVEEKPLFNDLAVFLNCHFCGQNFDYRGLQAHISAEHRDHLPECEFCLALVHETVPLITHFPEVEIPKPEPKDFEESTSPPAAFEDEEYWEPDQTCDYIENNSSLLPCSLCDKMYVRKDGLLRHIKDKHQEYYKLHFGPISKYETGSSEDILLEETINSDGTTDRLFICKHCGRTGNRRDNLRRHIQLKHSQEADKNASSCTQVVKAKPNSAARNYPSHPESKEKPPENTPRAAEIKINKYQELLELKNSNTGTGPSDSILFERKVNSDGLTERHFTCKICGRTGKRRDNLLRHIQSKHMHESSGLQTGSRKATTRASKSICVSESEESPAGNTQEAKKADPDTRRPINEKQEPELIELDLNDIPKSDTEPSEDILFEKKINSDGTVEKRYTCKICGRTGSRRDNLRRHIKNRHSHQTATKASSGRRVASAMRSAGVIKRPFPTTSEKKQSTNQQKKASNKGWFSVDPLETLSHQDYFKETMTVDSRGVRVRNYTCDLCGRTAKRKDNIRRHVKLRHFHGKQQKSKASSSCSRPKDSVRNKRPERYPGVFDCKVCFAKLSRLDGLRRHMMNKHEGYLCDRCLTLFSEEQHLREHDEEFHMNFAILGNETYPCDGCDKKFNSSCEHNRHKFSHYDHVCRKCNEAFSSNADLEKHDEVVHRPAEGYVCSECNASFENKQQRRIHMDQHKGRLCGICGLWTNRFSEHMRKHDGTKPFKCLIQFCGKSFASKQTYRIHRQTHSNVRPYACDFEGCGMRFRQKRTLWAHRNTHSGEKRYKCHYENCDRAFHGAFDLNLHLRRHTGEKPFDCEGCGEGFYTRSLLKKHQQTCSTFISLS